MVDENPNTPVQEIAGDPSETDNFIEVYNLLAEWIRFADAKATVVLTANGALATLFIPTLKPFLERDPASYPFLWWQVPVTAFFFIWLALMGLSSVWAFACINPFTRKRKHPALGRCDRFHPAAISARYSIEDTNRFTEDCVQLGASGLKREVLAGILIDSHISSVKYHRVSISIRMLGLSALFGLLYALAIQF